MPQNTQILIRSLNQHVVTSNQVVMALLVRKYFIFFHQKKKKKNWKQCSFNFRFVLQSSEQCLPPDPPHPYVPQQECRGRCFLVWPRCSSPFPTAEAGSSRWWWWQKVPLSCSCCLRLWPQFPWWCMSSVRQKISAHVFICTGPSGTMGVLEKKKKKRWTP